MTSLEEELQALLDEPSPSQDGAAEEYKSIEPLSKQDKEPATKTAAKPEKSTAKDPPVSFFSVATDLCTFLKICLRRQNRKSHPMKKSGFWNTRKCFFFKKK